MRIPAAAMLALTIAVAAAGCAPVSAGIFGSVGVPVHVVQVRQQFWNGTTATVRVERIKSTPAGSIEWTIAELDPSKSTVSMLWVDGSSPQCGEADRISVQERPDAVIIGVSDTARDPSLICSDVGNPRHFSVHLKHPIAGRALLEPATGVNDGLPHFTAGTPPVPTCSTDATPADAPIGFPEVATRIAPTTAAAAVICRTAWPNGRARTTETRLDYASQVQRLISLLNEADHPEPVRPGPSSCRSRSPGAWYAIYLTGPDLQVEVFVDEINCGTLTNGASRANLTSAIRLYLANAFKG